MKNRKLPIILNRIFSCVTLVFFGILFIYILFFGYENETNKQTFSCTGGQHLIVLVTGLALLLVFGIVFILLYPREPHGRLKRNKYELTDRNINSIIFTVCGFMFIIQLLWGYFLQTNPITDLGVVNKYAVDFAETGSFDLIQKDYAEGVVYLARYPNNNMLLLLLSFIYRLNYLAAGTVNMFLPIIVNALAINISVILTAFTAKKIFSNRTALYVIILCTLFLPYYTYTAFYYTDSLSMPLIMATLYLFVCGDKAEPGRKKYLLMLLSGALAFLAFKMKGNAILVAAAAVVYLALKYSVKRTACLALSLIAGFSCVGGVYTAAFNKANIITREQFEESSFPCTHWVMMGLKGLGNYSLADSKYTRSFPGKRQKQQANIEEILKRCNQMGADGMVKHTLKKAKWIWQDGTYYISRHLEKPVSENKLHSYVLIRGENHFVFFAYSCGFQLFLIFMICISALKGIIKPDIELTVFLRGIALAVLLFSIVWEARSRYLYNITPIFILLSADGMKLLSRRIIRHNSISYLAAGE